MMMMMMKMTMTTTKKKMTIDELKIKLDKEIENGTITPEEAQAELGAMEDQETARDLRSAGVYW